MFISVQVLNAWREVLRFTPECEDIYCNASGLKWPYAQLVALRDYFQSQWIRGGTLEQIAFWNHWHSNVDRTTNAAEAFHSVLSKLVFAVLFCLCYNVCET